MSAVSNPQTVKGAGEGQPPLFLFPATHLRSVVGDGWPSECSWIFQTNTPLLYLYLPSPNGNV